MALFKPGDIFKTYGFGQEFGLLKEGTAIETKEIEQTDKYFLYFIIAVLAFTLLLIAFSRR